MFFGHADKRITIAVVYYYDESLQLRLSDEGAWASVAAVGPLPGVRADVEVELVAPAKIWPTIMRDYHYQSPKKHKILFLALNFPTFYPAV